MKQSFPRQLTAWALSLALLLAVCLPVAAAESTATFSSPIVFGENATWTTVTGQWTGTLTGSKEKPAAVITVKKEFTGTITLDSVTIGSLGDYVAAIYVEPGAKPSFVLQGANQLSSGNYRAGVEVGQSAKVSIFGSGSLNVKGGAYGAGIGGGYGMTAGTIGIANNASAEKNYTRVIATGGRLAAGIGGGYNGGGGSVSFEGGYIKATGNGGAQDIGRGEAAEGVTLTVGTTAAMGGRLENFNKIDWSPGDTAERKEVKLRTSASASSTESGRERIWVQLHSPFEQQISIDAIPNLQGVKEYDTGYLYIPTSKRVLTLSVNAKGFDRINRYVYSAKDGETVRIGLTGDESSIKIDMGSSYFMQVGDTATFDVEINPDDLKNQDVTWTSSNRSVVTVDSGGGVTAKSEGTATITVTLKANPNAKYQCKVTVKP